MRSNTPTFAGCFQINPSRCFVSTIGFEGLSVDAPPVNPYVQYQVCKFSESIMVLVVPSAVEMADKDCCMPGSPSRPSVAPMLLFLFRSKKTPFAAFSDLLVPRPVAPAVSLNPQPALPT